MTVTRGAVPGIVTERPTRRSPAPRHEARDLQRTFRLLLATVWLMDAALQLQPFMFTKGPNGFSGMLQAAGRGNPSWVARTITWNASLVSHRPVLAGALFAGVQFLIAFGIAWRRTCRPALALSIVWVGLVWWFGEGLGGVLTGAATPLGGGPGSVLFYAVLAVLLWPSRGPNAPFVAARTVGPKSARAVWTAVWLLLALLTLIGGGRSPQALHDIVVKTSVGQPGWLLRIDRWSGAVLLHDGTTVAILFASFCIGVAVCVYLQPTVTRVVLVVAMTVVAVIWVAVQNVGGDLAGGATDPNSGLLVLLLALVYWPLVPARSRAPVVQAPFESSLT
jgi:hypothetical protein